MAESEILEEVTSQAMHKALRKVDVARSKFKDAQEARQNLHNNWMKYVEESVKRWRNFAEDFAKKDQVLEEATIKAKEHLQSERQHLDDLKEKHPKQDAAFLQAGVEVPSDMEEETPDKIEASTVIQDGIATMISTLDSIVAKHREPPPAEEQAAKKPKTGDGGGGSRAMEPFGGPSK